MASANTARFGVPGIATPVARLSGIAELSGIATLCLAACSSTNPVENPAIQSVSQPILNGSLAEPGELEEVVLITYQRTSECTCAEDGETCEPDDRSLCTGTLLRNDVVLTARHCVTGNAKRDGTVLPPEDIRVYASQPEDFRNQTDFVLARKVVAPFQGSDPERNIDIAVIFLEDPIAVNGSTVGHFTPIYPYDTELLHNELVDCAGYGATWSQTDDVCDVPPIDGMLRKATPELEWEPGIGPFNPDHNVPIRYEDVGNMGVQHFGDSGSACFSDLSYPPSAVGVTSTCNVSAFFGIPPFTHNEFCHASASEHYRSFVLDAIDDETPDFFPRFDTADALDEWEIMGGTWELTEHPLFPEVWGAAQETSADGTSRAIHDATIIENGIVRLTLQSPNTGRAGVLTRYVDAEHYYSYEVIEDGAASRAILTKVTPAGQEILAETACATDFSRSPDLFLTVTAENLQGFLLDPELNGGNGACILLASDSQYPTGRVGFGIDGLPGTLVSAFSAVHLGGSGAGWPAPPELPGSSSGLRPLSVDTPGNWTGPNGELPTNPFASEGDFSVELPLGYAPIVSRPFLTTEFFQVGTSISIDVFVPSNPADPNWIGDVQLFFSLPAVGLYSVPLGYANLQAGVGQWNTLEFSLTEQVRNLLLDDLPTASFTIATNSNPQNGEWLLDDFRFTGDMTPRTIFHVEGSEGIAVRTNALLSFEDAADWLPAETTTSPDSSVRSAGITSLAIEGSGWNSVSSVPFSTDDLPEVSSTLSLDVYVPSPQPNPYWVGDVQAYLTCPSAGLHNAYLGQGSLTNSFPEEFNQLVFPLSSEVQSVLTSSHDDCSFVLTLSVENGAGAFRFDRLGFFDP
jgi:hypothetical protein